jgi:cytochrome c biogenesis protein CcmG/thiol:disulfide interchange protein DsbE
MSDAAIDAPAVDPASSPERPAPRRRAPFIALAVAAVLGALFWVLASSASGPTDKSGVIESPLLGRPAPSLRSSTLDDQPFDLARRKGSWVVLNFFNSTCAPCRAEHPALVEFTKQQASFGDQGAELYTVLQYLDDVGNVKSFFINRGGDWPIVRDDDGTINVAFGVAQVPETFIIDPDGVVVTRWAGQIDANTLSQLVQQQRDIYEAS